MKKRGRVKIKNRRKRLEDFKKEVSRLNNIFSGITIKSERIEQAYKSFLKGDIEAANNILNEIEIEKDYSQLKSAKNLAYQRLEEIKKSEEALWQEYMLKAQVLNMLPAKNNFTEVESIYEKTEVLM
jgi:hypothetical protein